MALTDSQIVDLAVDAAYNEPHNNISRQEIAKRNGLPDDELRSVVNGDHWNRVRGIILEEMVRFRLGRIERNMEIAKDSSADIGPPPEIVEKPPPEGEADDS